MHSRTPAPHPSPPVALSLYRSVALFLLLLPACTSPAPTTNSTSSIPQPPGLRVLWWVVDDVNASKNGRESTSKVFSAFADNPSPFDAAAAETWRANGLRITTVPRAEIDSIKSRLNVVGPNQDQGREQLLRWSTIAAGAPWNGSANIALDNGPLELPAGRIRLLGRCWLIPSEPPVSPPPESRSSDSATSSLRHSVTSSSPVSPVTDRLSPSPPHMLAKLRLELVPQHEEKLPPRPAFDLNLDSKAKADAVREDARQAGLVFSRLALAADLGPDDCIVIVPDSPNSEWSRRRSPKDADPTSPDSAPRNESQFGPAGPPAPLEATLGEALLTDTFDTRRGRKLVVILLPGVPDRFELLRK